MQNGHLKPGDLIIRVAGVSVRGMGPDQVARLLRQSIVASMVSSMAPDSSDVASSLEGSSHFQQDTHSISSGPHSISPTVASTITSAVFPLRLVVARAAIGHPADLAAVLAQQEELVRNHQFIGPSWCWNLFKIINFRPLSIIPSGALDEPLDHLIRLMLPMSELEALCAFQSEQLRGEPDVQNFSAAGGLESVDATESFRAHPTSDNPYDLVETERPSCTSPPLLADVGLSSPATSLPDYSKHTTLNIQPPLLVSEDDCLNDSLLEQEWIQSPQIGLRKNVSLAADESREFSVVLRKPNGKPETSLGIKIIGYVCSSPEEKEKGEARIIAPPTS
ncbi:unnamed protein product [Schistocephalus solidus]|uniref:PDZ domain-containing protein n=1 Tax=Schistocephalus solidus TaxID=70667 RepID=A0A183T0I1_SCHSO|nr:unnamed protein product [Schistocephalus solidus]